MNVNIKDFKYEKMRKEQIKEFKILLLEAIRPNTVSMFCEQNRIDYFQLNDFLNMKTDKISGKILKAIERGSNYKIRFNQLVETLGMRMQIRYVNLGEECIGNEQRGIRPCIILGNEAGNVCSNIVNVAMITGAEHNKCKMPTHVELDTYCGLKKKSLIMLEQTRTIDKSRLVSYVGTVTRKEDIIKINRAINIANGTYNEYDEVSEIIETAEIQQNNSLISDILNFKSITKSFLNACKEKVIIGA
jgi:mRNA-degrading endonuclease toxin of MazEF toxin-antitoxin module